MYGIVLIVNVNSAKDLILTYRIPIGLDLVCGDLVSVPLRGKKAQGIILRITNKEPVNFKVADIEEKLSDTPVISRQGLGLIRFMSRYYVTPKNRVAGLFLPPPARLKHEVRYYLNVKSSDSLILDNKLSEIFNAFKRAGKRGLSIDNIEKRFGEYGINTVCEWEKLTYLTKTDGFKGINRRKSDFDETPKLSGKLATSLEEDQKKAVEVITKDIDNQSFGKHLLFGVTGSGKTEVYLNCAKHVQDMGKQIIYLVPEISLVPQLVAKAMDIFERRVAVLHSNLTPSQRYYEWMRIAKGEVSLIIGPRSALFAPVKNLGLIVIDEEHENTYKQSEPDPRYDARICAEVLARLFKAVVIRGSATPDIESYYKAKNDDYSLLRLGGRVKGIKMPEIKYIDMARELRSGHTAPVSEELLSAIRIMKEQNHQGIILMNRRGFHTYVLCKDCGKTIECPHCAIAMTSHKTKNGFELVCHYCGHHQKIENTCPSCGGHSLSFMGTGTQKVVDYLESQIKDIRILRLDLDSTVKAGSHEEILKAFADKKADLLVGTQMVSKGFDFPNVTLSAVVHIDGVLNIPDFTSAEKAFQLVTQTAGRSGRGEYSGTVYVQSFNPNNPVLQSCKSYDYEGFYEHEIMVRSELGYPPFTNIAKILVSSMDESKVKNKILDVYNQILKITDSKNISIMGPSVCPIEKIQGRYRYHIILTSKSRSKLIHVIEYVRDYYLNSNETDPRIIWDMDARSFV